MATKTHTLVTDWRFHRLPVGQQHKLLELSDHDFVNATPEQKNEFITAARKHLVKRAVSNIQARHEAGMKSLAAHKTQQALKHPVVQDEVVKMLAKTRGGK